MQNRYKKTANQKAIRLKKHREIMDKLENQDKTSSLINDFLRFESMGEEPQRLLRADWDKYFKECWKTKEATCFLLTKKCLNTNNLKKLKEIGQRTRERLLNNNYSVVKKPRLRDPYTFWNNQDIRQYKISREIVSKLENEIIAKNELGVKF